MFCEWLRSADWGDVPAWVGAIGTGGALIYALWQGRGAVAAGRAAQATAQRAVELAQQEARHRDELREDQLADQARTLVITRKDLGAYVQFSVENTGELAFMAVEVTAAYLDHGAPVGYTWQVDELPGSSLTLNASPVLRPGNHRSFRVNYRVGRSIVPNAQDFGPSLEVSYVDHRGTRWRRWMNTQPRRDSRNPAVHRPPPDPPPRYDPGPLPGA